MTAPPQRTTAQHPPPGLAGPGPDAGPAAGAGSAPGGGPPDGQDAFVPPGLSDDLRSAWRRWRIPLALIMVVVLGGTVSALIGRLAQPPRPNSYLDPSSQFPLGAHALSDILGERGTQVVRAYDPATALAAVRQTGRGRHLTLLITSPYLLTPAQRARLARARADLFLVQPGRDALAELAPAVHLAATGPATFGRVVPPGCTLPAARAAGTANAGGLSYTAPAHATACYRVAGRPSVIRYAAAGRIITVLGSGAPLANAYLGNAGNAALVLNLLGPRGRVVWLTSEPSGAVAIRSPGAPPRRAPALVPWAAWLVVIQLAVAVVLAALWRARRLGPLISERLPVVVRASETVEGHAGLYQARRARDRAAAALREAMLARVVPALGLAGDAGADAVTDALAARSRLSRDRIAALVYGQPPATDADLVQLARSLDELDREVRAQ